MPTLYMEFLAGTDKKIISEVMGKIERRHAGDAGVDLYVTGTLSEKKDSMGHTYVGCMAHTSVKCLMTEEVVEEVGKGSIVREYPVCYYLYPRSSICKTSMMMHNSTGIIDAGYRGEIRVPLVWVGEPLEGESVPVSGFYAQICSRNLDGLKVKAVEKLPEFETTRGEGGFGSTDK